jgi:hypothetical protein
MYVVMAFNESVSQSTDMDASQDSMPEDCPMMASMHSDKGESHSKGKTKSRHQACQLCMSLAATEYSSIKPAPSLPQPHAILRVERFSSAELLRFTKPPIY